MPKDNKKIFPGAVKRDNQRKANAQKSVFDSMHPIWIFDSTDNGGEFPFNIEAIDDYHSAVLRTILESSKRTWHEIKSDTHDKHNKSCNHILADWDERCSKEAKQRIRQLVPEEDRDTIFSYRVNNLVRIIGLKKDQQFIVKWFDPKHEFYPVD